MSKEGVTRHERDVLRAGYDGVDCLGRGRSFHGMSGLFEQTLTVSFIEHKPDSQ